MSISTELESLGEKYWFDLSYCWCSDEVWVYGFPLLVQARAGGGGMWWSGYHLSVPSKYFGHIWLKPLYIYIFMFIYFYVYIHL